MVYGMLWVYGMLEVVIVNDVYPSLACRIPSHVAVLHSEPLPGAIGSCRFHHYWYHLLHGQVMTSLILFVISNCNATIGL